MAASPNHIWSAADFDAQDRLVKSIDATNIKPKQTRKYTLPMLLPYNWFYPPL
jgi:hypothetical protein